MKVTTLKPETPETVLEVKKPVQQIEKKIATFIPTIDGGRIFTYNIITDEWREAEFRSNDTFDPTKDESARRMDRDPNCFYVEALNLPNAKKRLSKGKWFMAPSATQIISDDTTSN